LSYMRLSFIAFASAAMVAGCGDAGVGTSSIWHGGAGGQGPGSLTGSPGGAGGGAATGGGTSGGGATSTGTNGENPSGGGSNNGGTNSGGGGGSQPTGSVALMLASSTLDVNLLASVEVPVTVSATNFTGTVELSTQGLPSDVTATFDNPSVAVGATGASAKLTLATLSSTVSGPVSFSVVATAGSITGNATASLTVHPKITIDIPVNADANQGTTSNPRTDAFGAYPIVIAAPMSFPVTVIMHNSDSTPHEIHAGQAAEGFPHGAGDIAPGGNDAPRNVTQAGTYSWYLHDQGAATTLGRIVIQ
jgi:hypothetical protein